MRQPRISCLTVENTFSDWANNRQIAMGWLSRKFHAQPESSVEGIATGHAIPVGRTLRSLGGGQLHMIYSKGDTLSGG